MSIYSPGPFTTVIVTLLLTSGLHLGPAQAQLGQNLIPNPSFEEAAGALPTGWSVQRASQADPPPVEYPDGFEDLEVAARTGDRFLRLHTTDAARVLVSQWPHAW